MDKKEIKKRIKREKPNKKWTEEEIKQILNYIQEAPDFEEYIWKEESRKKSIQAWEQKYYENNRDVIEAKRQAENDARKEMERIEKEASLAAARKALEKIEAEKRANQPQHMTYTERMKQKWDELNLNRMMMILMSRKRVDAEQLEIDTALEKKRLAYEAAKKASLIQTLHSTAEEVNAIRARILPTEKPDLRRHDMILAIVSEVMETERYVGDVEELANEIIERFGSLDTIDYIEFLLRGEHRRHYLTKSLGGNTERWFWYSQMKQDGLLTECNWGYEQFVNANAEYLLRKTGSAVTTMTVVSAEPEVSETVSYEEALLNLAEGQNVAAERA